MTQIKAGTVTVTNGSATVTGSGTSWLGNVEPGDYFIVRESSGIVGRSVVYEVGGVASDTSLSLTAPWGGASASGVAYVIYVDFLSMGYAKLLPADLESAPIYNKTTQKLINGDIMGGLGSAATRDVTTSSTDTTLGRLLKVGDHGLGAVGPNNVLGVKFSYDDEGQTPNGFYKDSDDNLNLNGYFITGRNFGNNFAIRMSRINGISDIPAIFARHQQASIWQKEVELYHTGNILGTVSQSGGVPTGAIIERGSNANGQYAKFADGSVFMWGITPTVEVVGSSTDLTSINTAYPSLIIDNSVRLSLGGLNAVNVNHTTGTLGGMTVVTVDGGLSNVGRLRVLNPNGITGTEARLSWTAIGRWY